MASLQANVAFRFLDLPAELRCMIYAHAFPTAKRSEKLDVLAPERYLPSHALAAVCRQVRSECVHLARRAVEHIGANDFCIALDERVHEQGHRDAILRSIARLPFGEVASLTIVWCSPGNEQTVIASDADVRFVVRNETTGGLSLVRDAALLDIFLSFCMSCKLERVVRPDSHRLWLSGLVASFLEIFARRNYMALWHL